MKHYVYQHIRNDTGGIFYIGIGTKERKRYTRGNSINKRNNLWKKIYDKAGGRSVEILFESDDYEEVRQMEQDLITKYGKICDGTGCLANLTDGGEGALGMIVSEETREKLRKAHAGKNYHEVPPMLGKHHTEESKAQMSATRQEMLISNPQAFRGLKRGWAGYKHSEETKDLIRQKAIDRGTDRVKQMGLDNKGKVRSEEFRLKCAENVKNRPKKMRDDFANIWKGKKRSEETKEKMRLASIERHRKAGHTIT